MKSVFGEISFILLYVLGKFAIYGEPLESRNHRFINWRGLRPKCSWTPPQETQCENTKPVALIIKEFLHIEYYSLLCNAVNIGNSTVAVPTECFEWDGKAVDEHFITSGSNSWCNGPVKHTIVNSEPVLLEGIGMTFLHVDPPMAPPCQPFRVDSTGPPVSMVGFNVTNRDGYNTLTKVDCEPDIPTGALYNQDGSFFGFQHPRCSFSNEHKPIKYEEFHNEHNRPPRVEVEQVEKNPEELIKELHLNFDLSNDETNSQIVDQDVLNKLDDCSRSIVRNEVRLDDVARQNTRLVEKSIQLEQRVLNLEKMVKALTNTNDDEKNDIIEEIVDLKKANQNCDNKIESVSAECKNILNVMQEELKRYDDKSKETKRVVDEVQDKQSKANNNMKQIQKEISQLKTDIEKCTPNNLNTTTSTVEYTTAPTIEYTTSTELSIKNNYNSYTEEKVAAEIDYIHTKLEDLNELIMVNKFHIDGTMTQTQDLEAQLKEIGSNMQTSEPQLGDDDRIDKIISENKQLQSQIDNIHDKIKDLNNRNGNETIRSDEVPKISLDDLKTIENKLQMSEEAIKKEIELNKNNTDLLIDHLKSTIKDVENSLSDNNLNESFITNNQAFLEELQKEVTTNTKQIEELKNLYEENKTKEVDSNIIQKIEEDINDLRMQNNQMQLNVDEINTKLSNDTQFDDLYKIINDLDSKTSNIEEEIDDIKARINGTQPNSEENKPIIEDVLGEIRDLRAQNELTTKEIEKINDIVGNMSNFSEKIEEVEKSVDDINVAVEEIKAVVSRMQNENPDSNIQEILMQLNNDTTMYNTSEYDVLLDQIYQNIEQIKKDLLTTTIKLAERNDNQIENIQNKITNMELGLKNITMDMENIKNEIEQNIFKIQKNTEDMENLYGKQKEIINDTDEISNTTLNMPNNEDQFEDIYKIVKEIQNAINQTDNDDALKEIKKHLQNIENEIDDHKTSLEDILTDIENLYLQNNLTKNEVDELMNKFQAKVHNTSNYDDIYQTIDEIQNNLETKIGNISQQNEGIDASLRDLQIELTNNMNKIQKEVDNNTLNIQEISKSLQHLYSEYNETKTPEEDIPVASDKFIEEIRKSINNTEAALENCTNEINKLANDNNKLNDDMQKFLKELHNNEIGNNFVETINNLTQQIDSCTNVSQTNHDAIEVIRKSINNREFENESNTHPLEDIINDIQNLYSQNNETKIAMEGIETNLTKNLIEINQAINTLETKFTHLSETNNGSLEDIKKSITNTATEIENCYNNITNVQKEIDDNTKEIFNDIRNLYSQNNETKTAIDEIKLNLTNGIDENCNNEDINQVYQAIDEAKIELENIIANQSKVNKAKIDKTQEKIEDLQLQIGNTTAKYDAFKEVISTINNLKADLDETKNNLTEMCSKEDINKIYQSIEDAKNISVIKEIIKTVEAKLEDFSSNITNMQTEIDANKNNVSNITEEVKGIKNSINNVEADIYETKNNLTEMCSKEDLNNVQQAIGEHMKQSEFEEIFKTVEAKIENVTSNITNMQDEIDDYEMNIEEILSNIRNLYLQNNQSKAEIDATKDKIDEIQYKISNMSETNNDALEGVKDTINNVQADIDETKNNLTELCSKDDLNEVYQTIENVKNISAIEEIVKTVEERLENFTENITNLQNEIDEKINGIKYELEYKISNITEANKDAFDELMSIISDVKNDINETKNNSTETCSKDDLKKALENAKNQSSIKFDEIIKNVEAKINNVTSNITEAQNEIDENKLNIKEILNDIQILYLHNNQSITKVDETKDKINQLQHEIENLTDANSNEIKEILTRLNNITTDIDETKNNLTETCNKDDLNEVYQALEDAKNQSSFEFEEVIRTVEAKIENLTSNLTDAENDIDKNKQNIKEILDDIQTLYSHKNQSKADVDQTKNKIDELQIKLDNISESNNNEIKEIIIRINNITTDIDETKNNLTETCSKDDLNEVYQALEDAKNQSSFEFEEVIRTAEAKIENLTSNITDAENDIDKNKQIIKKILDDMQTLYSHNNQSKADVDQTKNKIDELQIKLDNLSESNNNKIKEILTRMNNITADIDETKNNLTETCSKDDLNEVYQALEDAKNQSSFEFEEIIKNVEEKLDNITSNMTNMQNQIDDNKANTVLILSDIKNLHSQNNETKIAISKINNRTRNIEDLLNRDDLYKFNQTINEIKNELETISETNNKTLEKIRESIKDVEVEMENCTAGVNKLLNDSSKYDYNIRDIYSRNMNMVDDINNLTKKIGNGEAIDDIKTELESVVANMSKISEDTIEDIKNLYLENNTTRTEIGEIINKLEQKITNASESTDYKFNYVDQRLDNITNDLKEKTANLTEQNEEALEEIKNSIEDEYKPQLQDILNELQNLHDQNNQTKTEYYEDLTRKINDTSRDLLEEFQNTIEEEKYIIFTELNKTRDDYNNIKFNIQDLYSQSNQTKTEITEAVDDLKTNISNVSLRYINMLEVIREDAQNTKLQLAHLINTTENYATNMSNLEEKFNEDIEKLDSKFEDLQNRTKQLDYDIEEINNKFYDLEKDSQNTTNVTQGVLRTIDILNSVNNETRHYIENTIDSIRSELNVLRRIVQEIHNDTEQRFKDIESLVTKGSADLQSKIEGLEGEVEALQYMNSRLGKRLEDETQALQDDLHKVQDDNEAINYFTERLSKSMDELEETVEGFESSAEKKFAASEQYHETLESRFKANNEQLTKRVDAFKNDQEQINDELFDEIAANVHDLKTYKTEVKEIIDFLIDPNVKLDENNYVNKNKHHDLRRK